MSIAPRSSPDSDRIQSPGSFNAPLTDVQFECLSRCAKGISLRFESSENVDALVAGGYAEVGFARVVTISAKGHLYLQMHRPIATVVRRDAASALPIAPAPTKLLNGATHGQHVPEPAPLGLLALALVGIMLARRRPSPVRKPPQ